MSELKCPFCQQELKCWDEPHNAIYSNWSCPNCRRFAYGNKLIWQELIRTRKVLDVAKNGLEYIFGYEGVPKYVVKHVRQVLDQIKIKTALKQKDIK